MAAIFVGAGRSETAIPNFVNAAYTTVCVARYVSLPDHLHAKYDEIEKWLETDEAIGSVDWTRRVEGQTQIIEYHFDHRPTAFAFKVRFG